MFSSRREKIQRLINAGSAEEKLGSDQVAMDSITPRLPPWAEDDVVFNTTVRLNFSEEGIVLNVDSGHEKYDTAIETILSDTLKRKWPEISKDELDSMVGML